LKFHIAGIGNFAFFLRKSIKNIQIFRSYRTSDADDAETHFLVHYRQFHLVCRPTGITRGHLHRIDSRGHFRSRDKDGGQTIRSAMSENPLLYANCTALSSIEPELLPIEVLHRGNREFGVFCE